MRVLVTGAAGFIGSHVTERLLQESHSVCAAVSSHQSAERLRGLESQLLMVPVDLRNSVAVRQLISDFRPECAIHLAWYAVPGKYWSAPDNLDCVAMSLSLAQALSEAKCRRLLAVGSCAEYDWNCGFLSEDGTPLRPRTVYGASKNATREVLGTYCEDVCMSFAWARLFCLYGPGEAPARLVPSVTCALLRGEIARCTQGNQWRDFLHVEDVASALWAVAKSDFNGAVNVASGEPVRVSEIFGKIGKVLGKPENIAPGALPLDRDQPHLIVGDIRRLSTEVGWHPSISLDDGLHQTVEWWRTRECQPQPQPIKTRA
jgi:nucleoside-diphosphate-sugar epimerase